MTNTELSGIALNALVNIIKDTSDASQIEHSLNTISDFNLISDEVEQVKNEADNIVEWVEANESLMPTFITSQNIFSAMHELLEDSGNKGTKELHELGMKALDAAFAHSKALREKNASWFNKLVDIAYYRGYPMHSIITQLSKMGYSLIDFSRALETKHKEKLAA